MEKIKAQSQRNQEYNELDPSERLKEDLRIEEQRLRLAKTLMEVRANLDSLGLLRDEQLPRLVAPDVKPLTERLLDILGSRSKAVDAAIYAAGATGLWMNGPSLEKTLTMLGLSAIAATAVAIAEWFAESEQGKRLSNSLNRLLGSDSSNIFEPDQLPTRRKF